MSPSIPFQISPGLGGFEAGLHFDVLVAGQLGVTQVVGVIEEQVHHLRCCETARRSRWRSAGFRRIMAW